LSLSRLSRRRGAAGLVALAAGLTLAGTLTVANHESGEENERLPHAAREFLEGIQGTGEGGGTGGESEEIQAALAQRNDARNAPGFALKGGYDSAVGQIGQLGTPLGGDWTEVTNLPYNADDTRYRDYVSNSSGGAGYVTGRVQALAAGGGYLFAGGAAGGVSRIALGSSGPWQAISDDVPALSSGDLLYDGKNLWYATGDGSTGGTTYVGDGVWVSSNPTDPIPTWTHIGGDTTVLNGAVIQHLRLSKDGKTVYVPTSFGVYSHSTTDLSGDWKAVWQPVPSALPSSGVDPTKSTANYVTDIALDPKDPSHMVAAYGWVIGGAANGWYDGREKNGSWTFTKINPGGAIQTTDIGRTTFAFSADGNRLYAVVQNPDHAAQGISYSELYGVFVSKTGSPTGPWSKIADSHKLANSGSALDPTVAHAGLAFPGYQPGVQAWYNQFLAVDPKNADHLFLGLEEVYETADGGAQWKTTGPYWNFFFNCWGQQLPFGSACPTAPHSDQHAVTFAQVGGAWHVFVGNDGGVYDWPLDGTYTKDGHGASWTSLTEKSTPNLLQYYSVGVGKQTEAITSTAAGAGPHGAQPGGFIVSGGLQDNGNSIKLADDITMGSNFGGDGGDVLVDPDNGCNIVGEYVELAMSVTNDCASPTDPNALVDPSKATTRSIKPTGETAAQFIAPFAADHKNVNDWIAGGQRVWWNPNGFAIKTGDEWQQQVDLGTSPTSASHEATAVASSGRQAIVGWCGSCSPNAYEGGYAFGALGDPSSWKVVNLTDVPNLPNRYVGGVDVYQTADGKTHYLMAFNGFSRRWVEGPGAGVGHLYTSTDGKNWTLIDGSGSSSLPDVPLNTVKWLGDGRIVVGSDLGAFISTDNGGTWKILGNKLPMTVVDDIEPGPDGNLYAATYGRGIWKLDGASIGGVAGYAGSLHSPMSSWPPAPTASQPVTTGGSTGGSGQKGRKH
jgi:hypothetical protein